MEMNMILLLKCHVISLLMVDFLSVAKRDNFQSHDMYKLKFLKN